MTPETLKRLKAALAGRDAVDIGHFQWVNLDMVRAEAGEKWELLKDKVYTASAHFIEKRLSADDVMVRCRGGFIIVFAGCGDAEARDRTELISQQLNLFFLGDRILQQFEISARSESVSVNEIADFMSRAQAAGRADRADAPGKPHPDRDGRGPAPSAGHWRPIDHDAPERAGHAAGDDPDADAMAAARKPPGVQAGRREEVGGKGWAAMPATSPQGAAEPSASYLTEGLVSELDKTWDDIIFKPCWDVRFNYLTTNFCLARRRYGNRILYGRDTLLGNDSPSLHRALDHAVVIAAQRGFLRRYADGEKCMIAIPVHYDTIIGVADRVRYFSILQCVPPRMRKYFYLRVDNIPEGAPQGQMEELFRAMCCFGSNILAKVPLGTTRLERFENCGISFFTSEMSNKGNRHAPSDATVAKLAAEAVSIQRLGACGGLTQVSTVEQLSAGLNAGFQVFTGDVIGRDLNRPALLAPCTLDDIVRRNSDAA